LDTVQLLTRGNPLRTRAFLEYLNPAQGIYTAISEEAGNISIIGQISHTGNHKSSHLSFIAPGRAIFSPQMAEMMDHLAAQAGDWGTFHLLVDADEHSQYFDVLRKSGFSVYAWQRIWKFQPNTANSRMPGFDIPVDAWQPAADRDTIPVKALCQSLVPALVQPVEPLFDRKFDGLLSRTDCSITGYSEIIHGREGLWVQPFIHPETSNVSGLLLELLNTIGKKCNTTVYICVRSYQAWIESALEELPVLASPRQALMVRHLAVMEKEIIPVRLPAFEKSRVKPSAPVAHTENRKQVY
jgi:hypothetical protein